MILPEIGVLHVRAARRRQLRVMALQANFKLEEQRLPLFTESVDISETISKLLTAVIIGIGIIGVLLGNGQIACWVSHQ